MRLFVDLIPYSVMSATADAVVVLAMHSVIAVNVFVLVAFVRATRARSKKGGAEPIQHSCAESSGVEVEVEGFRRDRVTPIASVGKGEGA